MYLKNKHNLIIQFALLVRDAVLLHIEALEDVNLSKGLICSVAYSLYSSG